MEGACGFKAVCCSFCGDRSYTSRVRATNRFEPASDLAIHEPLCLCGPHRGPLPRPTAMPARLSPCSHLLYVQPHPALSLTWETCVMCPTENAVGHLGRGLGRGKPRKPSSPFRQPLPFGGESGQRPRPPGGQRQERAVVWKFLSVGRNTSAKRKTVCLLHLFRISRVASKPSSQGGNNS